MQDIDFMSALKRCCITIWNVVTLTLDIQSCFVLARYKKKKLCFNFALNYVYIELSRILDVFDCLPMLIYNFITI